MRIEENTGHLALVTMTAESTGENRVELPRSHAEALLEVATGVIEYLRIPLSVGTSEIHLNRFTAPSTSELISVAFEHEGEAQEFDPPPWFGPEITADHNYLNPSIALSGPPEPLEVALTNEALESLLYTLENRFVAAPRPKTGSRKPGPSRPAKPLLTAEANLRVEEADSEEDLIWELARTLRPQRR